MTFSLCSYSNHFFIYRNSHGHDFVSFAVTIHPYQLIRPGQQPTASSQPRCWCAAVCWEYFLLLPFVDLISCRRLQVFQRSRKDIILLHGCWKLALLYLRLDWTSILLKFMLALCFIGNDPQFFEKAILYRWFVLPILVFQRKKITEREWKMGSVVILLATFILLFVFLGSMVLQCLSIEG